MIQKTLNPYVLIGSQHKSGLNSIISALPGSPTMDDLAAAVYGYIQPIYYSGVSPQDEIILKSIFPNGVNDFTNSAIYGKYSPEQMPFIIQLVDGIKLIARDEINDFILQVEQDIAESSLSEQSKRPLLIATAVGTADIDYWNAEFAMVAPASAWSGYFSTYQSTTLSWFPLWVSASMLGALLSYEISDVEASSLTVIQLKTNVVSALMGCIGLVAAKVVFKIQPKPVYRGY